MPEEIPAIPFSIMAKILFVEDNLDLAEELCAWLRHEKYTVEHVVDGNDASQMIELSSFDLIMLDWDLPGKPGIEVCRALRARGINTPVLMLTGKDCTADKVSALDAGADDYLTKPFSTSELGARLRALLRRGRVETSSRVVIGPLELDRNTHEVFCDGKKLRLFPKEYSLLEFFMTNPNRVFSPSEIINAIWTMDSNTSEDSLRTFMKTLRKKACPEGGECPIKTVYGFGYKLEG